MVSLRPLFFCALIFRLFFALPAVASTIYVDGTLTADCTAGNYSIGARACTSCGPFAGVAYRTPAAALAASVANDTIIVRDGSYTLSATLFPKAGQTWRRYNASETVVLDGNSGAADRAFQISNVSNVTIDGFRIQNTGFQGIWATVVQNGGLCSNTTVKNNTVLLWNWQNQNYYGAIKYSRCLGGLITGNYINNPKNGYSAGSLSNGGVDMGGECVQLDGGGTTISNNVINGTDIGQGIRLDVCAGHPNSVGGRHIISGNQVDNVYLGLHVEAGSSGKFNANTIRNSRFLAFESRARGGTLALANIGIELTNNTFDHAGWNLVRFIASDPGSLSSNVLFDSNTLISTTANAAALMVEASTANNATSRWNNSHFNVTGTGHFAICWKAPDTANTLSCPAGGTSYTDAQLTTFNSATGNTGNVSP